eukprot:4203747-Lingulodinium_polyedra.AAC.1
MPADALAASWSWLGALAAWASTLVQPANPCICDCRVGEHPAFELLKQQLDRCGPEHLAPAPAPVPASTGILLGPLLACGIFAAGGLIGLWCGRWVQPRGVEARAKAQLLELRARHGHQQW